TRFRNEGYYQFSREYIAFAVDSSLEGNYVDIILQIRNPEIYKTHGVFTISNVYVNVINKDVKDTIGEFARWHLYDSLWMNLNRYPLKEDILSSNILIRPGDLYSQKQVDNTYRRLNDILLLQQTGVTFEIDTSAPGTLLCFITLYPGKRQETIYEPQIITSDQNNAVEQANQRNYGIASAVTYRNKNLFRRAESFDLRYRISLEGQFRFNDSIPFFNNIENNFSTSLALPRITILRGLQRSIDIRSTKTTIIGSYIYESNIDFNRQVISLSYNEYFSRVFNSFNFTWLEVSFNKVEAKRNFLSLVNPADSIFVANLFVTNLIANSRFTWLYSDRFLIGARNHFSARTMLEPAGNTLYAFMRLTGQPVPSDGIYKIDNVNFEQYIKIDEDIQFNQIINSISSYAARLHLGVGLPYGNSKIMPFVRRYFIGGANSLRGWRPRTLGPGSFTTTEPGVRADRSGEMIIEAQAEYRFVLIENLLNGAFFMDAGNIWYTKPVEGREGAHFRMGTFMNEMAVDAGVGARFDFSFFVVRLDFGVPLRNPELPSKTRWLFDDYERRDKRLFRSIIFNLGLGYPF
ncbi:MAG TPA: BamA/TamA family outer membrane protein, partial [Bacteroidia bacterium]|nr:BamA/TamA family outer membrane protein [Bacteroidia bacterium]